MGRFTGFKHIVINEDGEAVIERNGYEVRRLVREKEAESLSVEELSMRHTDLTESEIFSALAYHAYRSAAGEGAVFPQVQSETEETPFEDDDFLRQFRIWEGAELYEAFNDAEAGFPAAA